MNTEGIVCSLVYLHRGLLCKCYCDVTKSLEHICWHSQWWRGKIYKAISGQDRHGCKIAAGCFNGVLVHHNSVMCSDMERITAACVNCRVQARITYISSPDPGVRHRSSTLTTSPLYITWSPCFVTDVLTSVTFITSSVYREAKQPPLPLQIIPIT